MTWPFPAADSDARNIDAALDDLAVDDPYATAWEPVLGSVHVAVLAATASVPPSAGSYPADARATDLSRVARARGPLRPLARRSTVSPTSSVSAIPLTTWQAEMTARGKMDCKFVCPSCGHKASPADFKAAGADPQRAPKECIGRVDSKLGGCDWAAFGLLDICPVHVVVEDRKVPVFAFAEAA